MDFLDDDRVEYLLIAARLADEHAQRTTGSSLAKFAAKCIDDAYSLDTSALKVASERMIGGACRKSMRTKNAKRCQGAKGIIIEGPSPTILTGFEQCRHF